MLTVKNVTKRYGKITVLDDISVEFEPGVYGLLAPNGAGKTTLLKMLVTLANPTKGEILWDGVEIGKLGASYREMLGYLPQQLGYYPDYSPKQYLKYLATLKGLDRETTDQRIGELLELVGLSDVGNKKMRKFSGGMIQRVGIAQALLNTPRLLILDEPTAGLDPKERVRFRNILTGLSKECIVILSTHIVSDVENVANHLLMIKDRGIAKMGLADELCGTLEGQVYETNVSDVDFAQFVENHLILSQRQERQSVHVRFVGGDIPEDAELVRPTLEDIYLITYR